MLVQYISVLSEVLHSTGQSKGQITQGVPVLAFGSSASQLQYGFAVLQVTVCGITDYNHSIPD